MGTVSAMPSEKALLQGFHGKDGLVRCAPPVMLQVKHTGACRWWTQFAWLLRRSLVSQLRNPTDVTSRLLLSAWIGLLAGAGTCCRPRCAVPGCQLLWLSFFCCYPRVLLSAGWPPSMHDNLYALSCHLR